MLGYHVSLRRQHQEKREGRLTRLPAVLQVLPPRKLDLTPPPAPTGPYGHVPLKSYGTHLVLLGVNAVPGPVD